MKVIGKKKSIKCLENRATNFIICDFVTYNNSDLTNLPQLAIFIRDVDHTYVDTERWSL